jgi:hypothetical protein
VKEVGEVLKLELGAKGGGKGPRWSGKWVSEWRPTKDGEKFGIAARGIPIRSQTLSQICGRSYISACDSHARCRMLDSSISRPECFLDEERQS